MRKPEPSSKKSFELVFELIGWLQIVVSPLVIGLIIGAVIYFNKKDSYGLIAGIAIAVIGLIIGIVWATRAWKKKGTIYLTSRVMSSHELDNKTE